MHYVSKIAMGLLLLSLHVASGAQPLKLCGVEWPPFSYADGGKLSKGISVDIYTEAFARLNRTFEAFVLPWPRCLDLVKSGSYDGVMDNAADASFAHGNTPTSFYALAIYVRSDHPAKQFSWDGMRGKTVGMVRGYDYTEKIKSFTGWKVTEAATDEQLIGKLMARYGDYIVLDIYSAPILSKQTGASIRALEPLMDFTPLYLDFNKKHQVLAGQFNASIDQMIADGTIDKIFKKYTTHLYADMREKR